jgi:hypothetical protein
MLLLAAAPISALEAIWIGPDIGAWNVAANWSSGVVPNPAYTAQIDDDPTRDSRVESRFATTAGLLVVDAGDTLAVINSSFYANRPVTLDGTISVEGTGQLNAFMSLNPDSELRLSGSAATATTTFFHNQGDIHGGGRFTINPPAGSSVSYNENTIRADHPTIPLTLQLSNSVNFINNGVLMATGGGRLQIQRGYAFDDPIGIYGGRIEAHPDSTVAIGSGSTYGYIEDAVLATVDDDDPLTSAPSFEFFNTRLQDVSLEGNFKLSGATILGSLRNLGEITSGTAIFPSNWHNYVGGDVLLSGGGTINLASTVALFGGGDFDRVINVDNVIRGHGELLVSWTGFTNRHVVQADAGQNKELYFYNGLSDGLLINSGVMKSINGGRLRLGYSSGATGVMENFEAGDQGEVIAGENSSVFLSNIHIKGGVLRTEGDDPATRGKHLAESLVILEDVTTDGDFRFQTLAGQLSTITLNKTVNNTGSMTGRFAASASAELTGGGEIIGESGVLFTLGQNASIVNVDNVIHGNGNINGFAGNRFTNQGTIRSDGQITINTQLPFVNRGRLEAAPGAQLTLPIITTLTNIEDGIGGVIHAADGGVVNFGRIDGGVLSTEGTGVIRATGGVIKDLHNLGTVEATLLAPQGTIVNDGIIKAHLNMSSGFARLDGTGQWEATNGTHAGGIFINGPLHTILGSGDFGSGSTSSVVVNEGTMRAKEGSPFRILVASFENTGLVHAPAERTLNVFSSFTRAENSGTMQVDGILGVTAPDGLHNLDEGLIDVQGQLSLGQTVLRNRISGMITGSGEVTGSITTGPLVLNEGIIEPGEGIATLQIGDDFQQLSSGQLQMEIAGGEAPSNDLLAVDGLATLAGTLVATLVGEESLAPNDSFTLLTATGGIAGAFDQWVLPDLPDDQFWFIEYDTNQVRATVEEIIPGDFNLDGTVDTADYVAWIKTGGNETQLGEWRSNFGSSVANEPPPLSTTVPEPATVWMLLMTVTAWLGARRAGPFGQQMCSVGKPVPSVVRPQRIRFARAHGRLNNFVEQLWLVGHQAEKWIGRMCFGALYFAQRNDHLRRLR